MGQRGQTTILGTIPIVSTPGVLGGKPRIEGRRVSVQQVARHHQAGWPAEEIAEAFSLTLGQVYAALSYYHEHRVEIDRAIREEQALVDQARSEREELAQSEDVLGAVMTAAAAAAEYGLADRTVRDAIQHGWIEARKSGGTWLIRCADAEARWGRRKQ
jgi:uncharacterized protein (DUF433 family)